MEPQPEHATMGSPSVYAALEPLQARHLGSWYVRNGVQELVFRDVSFDVQPGQILGVFGANGIGKTTLIKTIAGLNDMREGTVTCPSASQKDDRASLAYIPQGYQKSFFPWASLETSILLTFPAPIAKSKRNRENIRRTASMLGIDLALSLHPGQCSGGMLQQAALVRAFCQSPQVILADEPFSALDVAVANSVRGAFVKAVRSLGICTVIVLHSIEDILEVCDSVLIIPARPFTTNSGHSGFGIIDRVKNARLTPSTRKLPDAVSDPAAIGTILREILEEGQ